MGCVVESEFWVYFRCDDSLFVLYECFYYGMVYLMYILEVCFLELGYKYIVYLDIEGLV